MSALLSAASDILIKLSRKWENPKMSSIEAYLGIYHTRKNKKRLQLLGTLVRDLGLRRFPFPKRPEPQPEGLSTLKIAAVRSIP
jgi:hypothetical protein